MGFKKVHANDCLLSFNKLTEVRIRSNEMDKVLVFLLVLFPVEQMWMYQ